MILIHCTKRHKVRRRCTVWNAITEYSSWQHKFDINYGNISNPLVLKQVQRQKHHGRWAITEPKLPIFTKPKYLIKYYQNGDKNIPVINVIIIMK